MQPPSLNQYQKAFTENLLSRQLLSASSEEFLSHIKPMFGETGKEQEVSDRFTIYRNNVILSLSTAIADSFPIVKRLIGEDCFTRAAIEYVRTSPPEYSSLLFYGEGFIDFIRSYPACAELNYIADVARLEWLYINAFHAQDSAPLDIGKLQTVSPEDIGDLYFECHPSSHLLMSDWPIDAIWEENLKEEVGILDVANLPASKLLIYRRDLQVQVVALTTNCFNFLYSLKKRNNIAEAWSYTLELQKSESRPELDESELGGMLGYLIGLSVFTEAQIKENL